MGTRLTDALDKAHFSYSYTDFEADWKDISEVYEHDTEYTSQSSNDPNAETVTEEDETPSGSALDKIQQAKQMLDAGIISDEEFSDIKAKLIAQM